MTRSAILLLCLGLGLTVGTDATRSAPIRHLSFSSASDSIVSPWKASVLVDTGTGRFVRVKAQGSRVAVADAIGDLNGDGRPDLVTHENADEEDTCDQVDGVDVCPADAFVLFGRKNGNFGVAHSVFESDSVDVTSSAIGNVNGDGRPDLLLALRDDVNNHNGIVVKLGLGKGKFRSAGFLRTPYDPLAVAVADVNRDGRPDVVTANAGGTVSVFLNRGGGKFAHRRTVRVGPHPSALAVGDLNGDHRPDLAVARSGPAVHAVTVLLNRGRGSFGARHDYGTGDAPDSVAIGDLNGDRRPDLVTANGDAGTASVLLNEGGGAFASRLDYATGSLFAGVAIGRFDHNSSRDLVLPAYHGVAAVLVNTTGTCDVQDVWGLKLPAATTKLALAGCSVGTVGHVSSTGFAAGRILAQSPEAGAVQSGAVDVTVSDGPGPGPIAASPAFGSAHSYSIPKNGQVVAVADLNGDGAPDVVTGNCGSSVSVFLNNGHGALGAPHNYHADCPDTVALADLNGDGRPDIVAAGDDAVVSVLLSNGGGTFAPAHVYALDYGPTYGTSFVVVGDLNGDGVLDVAAANDGLSVFFGNGDGTFGPRKDYKPADMEALALGDLNGDGKPDLVFNDISGVGEIFNQGGGQLVQSPTEYVTDGEGANVVTGGLTGNGVSDVVATYPDGGVVQVLLNDGSGALRPYADYRTAAGPAQAAIGDLNGDGTSDLAVAGKSLSILRNRGDGTFMAKRDYSMGPNRPRAVALGDLNGDGKLDLVSVNGATVVVRIAG